MRNPRKNRSKTVTTGEFYRPGDAQLRIQRPWENRSFDAALASMSQFR